MEQKKRSFLIGVVSAAIGGGLGAVSGSNSWMVVMIVSAVFAVLVAWALNSMIK
jgi:hypothetical protein